MKKKLKASKHQDRQARILSELIDKKIEARISGFESTMTKMFRLFKKMKQSTSPKKMVEFEKELKSVKDVLEDFDVKNLEEDVFKQFSRSSSDAAKTIETQKKDIEEIEIELSAVKKSLSDFQIFEKEFTGLDISNLKKDIESLKVKSHWLEMELEKLSIRPLLEKMNELESRISTIRLSHPTIIE